MKKSSFSSDEIYRSSESEIRTYLLTLLLTAEGGK